MPQLGIEASSPASANETPRAATSEGIRKATPLMKRKELDVTPTEISVIDQRAPALNEPGGVGAARTGPCLHTGSLPSRRKIAFSVTKSGDFAGGTSRLRGTARAGPQRPAAPRSRPSLGSSECVLVESPARTASPSSASKT